MGTVFRRHYRDAHGNRRECATWTVRLCRDGQRIELPSGTTKRGEALTTLKLLEGDAARGIPVTATGQKLTVDHAMAEVIADYRQNGRRTVGDLEQRWTGHRSRTSARPGRARVERQAVPGGWSTTCAGRPCGTSCGPVSARRQPCRSPGTRHGAYSTATTSSLKTICARPAAASLSTRPGSRGATRVRTRMP